MSDVNNSPGAKKTPPQPANSNEIKTLLAPRNTNKVSPLNSSNLPNTQLSEVGLGGGGGKAKGTPSSSITLINSPVKKKGQKTGGSTSSAAGSQNGGKKGKHSVKGEISRSLGRMTRSRKARDKQPEETFTDTLKRLHIKGGHWESIADTSAAFISLIPDLNNPFKGHQQRYFNVLNHKKHRMFLGVEESFSDGGSRPFKLSFYSDELVFSVERPGGLALCLLGEKCCGNHALVKDSKSRIIGGIQQTFACGQLQYRIYDGDGRHILSLEGAPAERVCLRSYVGNHVCFQLTSGEDPSNVLGSMRVYTAPQPFTSDHFIFSLEFLLTLSPEHKLVVLGVGALIDLSYFESRPGLTCNGNYLCWLLALLLTAVIGFLFFGELLLHRS